MEVLETNVALVGAGPIGLELAVALMRAGIDYVHLDARQIGYTISWFAPETRFFSSNERIAIAGVPLQTPDQSKASREQYLAYLRMVVTMFDLKVRTYEPVTGIERQRDGGFMLTTQPQTGPRRYRARRVVLATGGTARPRTLGIPGETLPHVTHYLGDPHDYFRRRVVVVGGRNSAVEGALRCYHAGADVTISYRGAEFDRERIKYWLLPEIKSLMKPGRIKSHFNTQPVEITPSHMRIRNIQDGQTHDIPADVVLLLIGYEADMSLFRMAGVELDPTTHAPRFNEQTMETSVEGLYVAGTAAGGTQEKYVLFIENCHVHAERIVAALTGAPAPTSAPTFERPES